MCSVYTLESAGGPSCRSSTSGCKVQGDSTESRGSDPPCISQITTIANIPSLNDCKQRASRARVKRLTGEKSCYFRKPLENFLRQFEQNCDLEQARVSFSHAAYLKIFQSLVSQWVILPSWAEFLIYPHSSIRLFSGNVLPCACCVVPHRGEVS